MADPTIPTPLTSGTTDQPNAPQEGEWQDYKPATKAKTDEGWQDYKPAPAVRASTKTPTEKAAENAVITTPPSNIDLIKGFVTDAASQVRHNPMEFAKGVAKAVIPTAQGALPQADSTELDAATKAKLEKEEENPNLAERILEGTSEALHIPQAFKKVQDVVTPYLTPQNSAQQAGSDVGQLTGQMYGAVEMGKGAMGMVRPGTYNPSRVALTRPEPVPQLLVDELNAKQAAFNKAKTDVDVYQHSQAKGAEPPAKVQKAFDKAKKELVEAQFHYNTAKDAIRPKTVKPQPVDHFQGFQQDIDSMAPGAPGAPEQKPINVKGPGEVKPETISQPLTEKPMIVPGQKQLPKNQGRMGVTNMLPEAPLHLPQEVLPSEHSMVKTNVPAKVTEPKTVVVEMRVPKSRYGAPTKTVSAKTPTGVPQVMPVEAPASSMEAEITKNEPKPASPVKPMSDKIGEEVRKGTGGAEDLKPNVPLKEQGTAKEPVKLSSDPRKAALQRAGATDEEISKILARGTKTDPTSKVGASKLAEHFGIDLGQSAVGRGKADAAAGTHISPAEILQTIIDAGHSPSDIAKAVDEGKHLPTASGGSQAATPRLAADIGEWKAPPELGVATAEDVGAKVRAKNPEPAGRGAQTLEQSKALDRRTGSGLQEGQTEHRVGDRRTFDRSKQTAEDNYFKQAVRELGSDATDEAIDKRIAELKTAGTKDVATHANEYNKEEKLGDIKPEKVEKSPRAKEISDAYAEMKHDPNNPEVKKSYEALKDDVKKQWDYATEKMGIKIVPTEEDPYKSYEEMRDDVKNNKQLKVFKGGNPLPKDHPLADVDPKTGETYNTMFRAVHDLFGHTAMDNDFSEPGEESAWNIHRQMMSPEAVPAMTTETRGQTSWFFNHGETPGEFAEQKAGILPEFANHPTPDAKSALEHIKSGKDYAVLTAENPGNKRLSAEENAQRNRALVADLQNRGYEVVPVEGGNKDVEGKTEHSYFVKDIPPKEAAELGRKHGQESVLTTEGLHHLDSDIVDPSDNKNLMTGEDAKKQDYYTKIGDQSFSVPLSSGVEIEGQGGHAGGGISSEEELSRPGKHYIVKANGDLTYHGKSYAPEETPRGAAHVTVKPNGEFQVNEGTLSDAGRKALEKAVGKPSNLPKGYPKTATMSDAELERAGYSKEDISNGKHLESASGGSQSAGTGTKSAKELPTGDDLIKKYGESSGDPAHTTFILKDGRGVANTGIEHDQMLGGKATDTKPPRERFIAQGNIRVRPRMGTGGRETALSIPESGINTKQLDYIKKMAPQLRSGAVLIEVGKPGGDYRVLPQGEASDEAIGKALKDLAPIVNDKGSPVDEFGNPTISGGSQSAGAAPAKVKATEEELPELAEKHLTPEERASVTKSSVGRRNFVEQLSKVPSLQEWVDAAKGGEGARHWYQRSNKAFDFLHEEAPRYFQQGDREKWGNFVASLSPRQMVHNNLEEALMAWTKWVDDGRPMDAKGMEKSLRNSIFSAPDTKVPNAMKALKGEDLWPDLFKNRNFKVPSFGKNLNGYLNYVTNDGWEALFGGLDEKTVSNPSSYHPLSVMTRAAAEELGWEPAEAQSAIWSFTQALKEKGEVDPEYVRQYSEDFADIMRHNAKIREQLKDLGVDLGKLDTKIDSLGEKPKVATGASATTGDSTKRLAERIEAARGKGSVPEPKLQRSLIYGEREAPATEGRSKLQNEDTSFNPETFGSETDEPVMKKPGKKKSPLKNML